MTARQELSRQGVGQASPDNSDTHGSNAGRGPASTRPQDCALARPARPVRHRRTRGIQQRRHRRRAAGPAELQGTQRLLRWRTGDVARRRRWRTGAGGHRGSPHPESWTGGGAARARTRRAGVYALLDWDNLPGRATRLLRERDVGRSWLDRDLILHLFTHSLHKGLRRDQLYQYPIQLHYE